MLTAYKTVIAATLAAMLCIVGCTAQNVGKDMQPTDDRQVSWGNAMGGGI